MHHQKDVNVNAMSTGAAEHDAIREAVGSTNTAYRCCSSPVSARVNRSEQQLVHLHV